VVTSPSRQKSDVPSKPTSFRQRQKKFDSNYRTNNLRPRSGTSWHNFLEGENNENLLLPDDEIQLLSFMIIKTPLALL